MEDDAMGSLIGAAVSLKQYKDGKKTLAKWEAEQKAAEAQAKASTPAVAQVADTAGVQESAAKKRRGVQSTFVASRQEDTIGG